MPTTSVCRQDFIDTNGSDNIFKLAKEAIELALETNRAVSMKHAETLGVQADETEAILEGGKLTDSQVERLLQENREIRGEMAAQEERLHRSNREIIISGIMAVALGGSILLLRAA